VEAGRVPKGSYLIVENLDRLSREHIQSALILFLNLLQAGVRVVQLVPAEQVYDDKSEAMQIMMAVMELSRGNSESRMKSERIGRAWADLKRRAATDKTPITSIVPAWLRVQDGEIVTIPKRAEVVRRIYRLVIEGHGLVRIAKKLSTEKVATFGKSDAWNPSSVHKIVHSRAALGEYQPKKHRKPDGDPIAGYFPAVIEEKQWYAAQAALAGRHEGGRRTARQFNPFAGLLIDARDGGKMYVTGPSGRANMTLVNYGATHGKPGAKFVSFPLRPFAESLLTNLREISVAEVAGTAEAPSEVPALEGRLADLEGRIAKLQAELATGEVKSVVAGLRNLEADRDEVNELLIAARAKSATPLSTAITDCHGLIDLMRENDTEETRVRLKGAARRVIDRVMCLFVARGRSRVAAVQVWFKGTNWHRDFLISYTQGRGNAQVKTPASWFSVSNAWPAETGQVDLRNKADAQAIEKFLAAADVGDLCVALGAPRPKKEPAQKRKPKGKARKRVG
jgi:hypothetical protein